MTATIETDIPLLDLDVLRSIEWPDGYDSRQILHHFGHSAWRQRSPVGTAYRRWLCEEYPLGFALTYLPHYFADQVTRRLSMSEMHMDLARDTELLRHKCPRCRAEVGPRESGKSTWRYLIGPLWSFAFDHQRLIVAFSYTDIQASGNHLARLKDVIEGRDPASELLLNDFPGLRPIGKPKGQIHFANGCAIICRGLKSAVLGTVRGTTRPTMILGDDLLPGADTTPEVVESIKKKILANVLPLAERAQVILCGTVFKRKDLMDDVWRIAEGLPAESDDRGAWLISNDFKCRYYRPDWPQRWPIEMLLDKRAKDAHTFALRYAPHLLDQAEQQSYWTRDTWVYDQRFPTVERLISIDHAVSAGRKADHTAIAILGGNAALGTTAGRAVVEHVEQLKTGDLHVIHGRIWELWQQIPRHKPTTLVWERNNGGEMLAGQLRQLGLPEGLKLETWHANAAKPQRVIKLHRQCVSGLVKLRAEFPDFQTQAENWHPASTRDDMLDAVASGARRLLDGTAEM